MRLDHVSPANYVAKGRADERAKIVAWLRTYPLNKHAREWADAIEAHEDDVPGPNVSTCGVVPTHSSSECPSGFLGCQDCR